MEYIGFEGGGMTARMAFASPTATDLASAERTATAPILPLPTKLCPAEQDALQDGVFCGLKPWTRVMPSCPSTGPANR